MPGGGVPGGVAPPPPSAPLAPCEEVELDVVANVAERHAVDAHVGESRRDALRRDRRVRAPALRGG